MQIILLSGGCGKRLWPISNDVRSKQFLKFFRDENAVPESMIQRMYKRILALGPEYNVTVATSGLQVPLIKEQLGDDVGISIEPCRRDTFPAIALAVSYLHDIKGVPEDEAVVVCPVDPFVEDDYFKSLAELGRLASAGESGLILLGMEPTFPCDRYGYIIPTSSEPVSRVDTFKEKPDTALAEKYISLGALWNGGVFAFKLGYILDRAHELIEFRDYNDLFSRYSDLERISFDFAVVENEANIQVLRFKGVWSDIGTWDSLSDVVEEDIIGPAVIADDCSGVKVINETSVPVLCKGLEDVIVTVSEQGILITSRKAAAGIKDLVDKLAVLKVSE